MPHESLSYLSFAEAAHQIRSPAGDRPDWQVENRAPDESVAVAERQQVDFDKVQKGMSLARSLVGCRKARGQRVAVAEWQIDFGKAWKWIPRG